MSMSGLLFVPAIATIAPAAQLREMINMFPNPPVHDGDTDPYSAAVLRDETGALAALVSTLSSTAESIYWGTLVAHHAMRTPAELRAHGWTVEDRHAVNPIRTSLNRALRDLGHATDALEESERHARALVEQLHPADRTDA